MHGDDGVAIDVPQHPGLRLRFHEGADVAMPHHGRHGRALPHGIRGEQVHKGVDILAIDRFGIEGDDTLAGALDEQFFHRVHFRHADLSV